MEQLDKTMELKTLVEGEEETQDGGEASGVGREPDVEEWVLEGGLEEVAKERLEDGSGDRCLHSRQNSKVQSWGNPGLGDQLTSTWTCVGGTHCRSGVRQLGNEMEVGEEMVPGQAERWDILEDKEQLEVEVVEEVEVVVEVSRVRDRCWSSHQSSRGLHGGNQGLEPQQTNSGCQGGSVDSGIGAVEACTGRRWGGEVGGVVGLVLGADAEEEEEGLSVVGGAVVVEDAEQTQILEERVGLVEV